MTNRDFAASDRVFIKACELAKLEPTPRQASKYRNNYGRAYEFKVAAMQILNGDGIDKMSRVA